MARTVIDPLTRIEGHMRVEVEVDRRQVTDAWVSGTLYRGMEIVLKGRRPQDAFYISQRICGVCPISHGHASTMSAEAGDGIQIPTAPASSATSSRPHSTCTATFCGSTPWRRSTTSTPLKALEREHRRHVRARAGRRHRHVTSVRSRQRLAAFVENGQLSIFTNGWFDHPAYAQDMPPELAPHRRGPLPRGSRDAGRGHGVIAIMGGKFPHS